MLRTAEFEKKETSDEIVNRIEDIKAQLRSEKEKLLFVTDQLDDMRSKRQTSREIMRQLCVHKDLKLCIGISQDVATTPLEDIGINVDFRKKLARSAAFKQFEATQASLRNLKFDIEKYQAKQTKITETYKELKKELVQLEQIKKARDEEKLVDRIAQRVASRLSLLPPPPYIPASEEQAKSDEAQTAPKKLTGQA